MKIRNYVIFKIEKTKCIFKQADHFLKVHRHTSSNFNQVKAVRKDYGSTDSARDHPSVFMVYLNKKAV